ncbi:MAG: glycosyltransferase family 2 protein [Candidatus Latescibacterota bacterium]|jgi:glycosyltransferase involved in cell wall biosynthesis
MGSSAPRVTVGIPVYNGEPYLEQAIASLLGQSYPDFELIISDNASTDGTEGICREFARQDGRVRYERNETNVGAAANYNRLVDMARGRYFKWAAHDDLCAREYLERCVEIMDRDSSVVVCYPKTRIIDERGRDKGPYEDNLHLTSPHRHERFRDVVFRDEGECNAVFGLIRMDVLERTGLIGNYPASDMILLSELALHGTFYELPEPLFQRRDHPQTSIRANVTSGDRAAWFDPKKKDKAQFTHWRWVLEYHRAISRAGVGAGNGVRCYRYLGRWIRWNRNHLAGEVRRAVFD